MSSSSSPGRRLVLVGMCVALTAGVGGCGGDGPTGAPPETPVGSVVVSPDSITIDKGDTVRLTATVRDRFGDVLPDREVTWKSSDTTVAPVDDRGLLNARKAGFAIVRATAGLESDKADVTVIGPPAVFDIRPDSQAIFIGMQRPLTLVALDGAGNDVSGRITATWSSSAPGIATVDEAGVVTGVAEGRTVITASFDTLSDAAPLMVLKPIVFTGASAGETHTCGTSTEGQVFCWGANDSGQLGVNGTGHQVAPVPVSLSFSPVTATAVTAGAGHTCALLDDGSGKCWGQNTHGEIGDGTTSSRSPVTDVAAPVPFSLVTAGGDHTCAIGTDSLAYCWGANDRGQLGDGTNDDRAQPTPVSGGLKFLDLDAGRMHTCGVTKSDDAVCWGANDEGQLGDGTTTDRTAPTTVAGGLGWTRVSAGAQHSCGVTMTGEARCWGWNGRGQLGDGTTTERMTPVAVAGGLTFIQVSAGSAFTCGVIDGNLGRCWGANDHGQLGDGSQQDRTQPSAVSGDLPFVQIATGDVHTCGLTSEPLLYCWGLADARLGGPTSFSGVVNIPMEVEGQVKP